MPKISIGNIWIIKNVLTLGYLGRIAETKGIEYLLEACVELKRRNIPFVLRMAEKKK